MKIDKTFVSLLFLIFVSSSISSLIGQVKASPFSSPEEKRFILKMAGRDGQIDKREWEENATDRGRFKFLSWDSIQDFDLDGDGLIGVNELYRYVEWRVKSARAGSENDPSHGESNPMGSSASRILAAQKDYFSSEFDRGMLFRRAQFARRTKFRAQPDPQEELELNVARMKQLEEITEQRRAATRDLAKGTLSKDEMSSLRRVYQSRLVKNRLPAASSASSDISSSRRRALTSSQNRLSVKSDDLNRRRDALLNKKQKAAGAQSEQRRRDMINAQETHGSSRRDYRSTPRSRETSNIRGLIQPSDRPSNRRSSDSRTIERDKNPTNRRSPSGTGSTNSGGGSRRR